MRNLLAYPITIDEVIQCLERLADEHDPGKMDDPPVGDMTYLLIHTAINYIKMQEMKFLGERK